jgi:hypothetical protein
MEPLPLLEVEFVFMRRCNSAALSIILGIALRISVLLCLKVGRQSSIL